ncbi:hypothetical protein, partial [Brevibacillus agri]
MGQKKKQQKNRADISARFFTNYIRSFPENWICMFAKSVWISPRPISIRQLHALPRFHTEPI